MKFVISGLIYIGLLAISPAYDLLSTIPYIPSDGLALNLGDSKDIKAITLDNFKKIAKKANIPEALVLNTVRDTAQRTYAAWAENHKHYEMPSEILERINQHMQEVQLATKDKKFLNNKLNSLRKTKKSKNKV